MLLVGGLEVTALQSSNQKKDGEKQIRINNLAKTYLRAAGNNNINQGQRQLDEDYMNDYDRVVENSRASTKTIPRNIFRLTRTISPQPNGDLGDEYEAGSVRSDLPILGKDDTDPSLEVLVDNGYAFNDDAYNVTDDLYNTTESLDDVSSDSDEALLTTDDPSTTPIEPEKKQWGLPSTQPSEGIYVYVPPSALPPGNETDDIFTDDQIFVFTQSPSKSPSSSLIITGTDDDKDNDDLDILQLPSESPTSVRGRIVTEVPTSTTTFTSSGLIIEDPTEAPTEAVFVFRRPTPQPTGSPIDSTREPTESPTDSPTDSPTISPSEGPTKAPTEEPSEEPTFMPTLEPSEEPSEAPTEGPTPNPTLPPTSRPSAFPTKAPTMTPTATPTADPTPSGSFEPTISPEPTIAPTTSREPTSQPTLRPTPAPTLAPSPAPSPSPSSAPSLPRQDSASQSTMELFPLPKGKFLDERNEIFWRTSTEKFIKDFLLSNEVEPPMFDVDVGLTIQQQNQGIVEQDVVGTFRRVLQEEISGEEVYSLVVKYYITIGYRSNGYDHDANQLVWSAFGSPEKRATYIANLQQRSGFFQPVEDVKVEVMGYVPTEAQAPVGGTGQKVDTAVIVGASVGGVAFIILLVLLFLRRRSGKSIEEEDVVQTVATPSTTKNIKVSTEILVEPQDDVSTLGDPMYGQGGMMMGGIERDEMTATVGDDYDYTKHYRNARGPLSLSGTANTRDRTISEDMSKMSSVQSSSVGKLGKMSENIFADDSSFEQQFINPEERLDVVAPAGKLGMVIDTPNGGIPVVHAIKDTSVLVDQVEVGDRLLSVDGEDCTGMTAMQVSKLISLKSEKPARVLVFARTATSSSTPQ